jgi:hypothetical protein
MLIYDIIRHLRIFFNAMNQRISVQIDHLLVSPFGVFLIETKNWSDQSLNNLSLRSPVQQIKELSCTQLLAIITGVS